MPNVPNHFVLQSDIEIQTRRAQAVDPEFADAVRRVCQQCPSVKACYLLDARLPGAAEVATLIALTLDDEEGQLLPVAQQFQEMLAEFPARALKTFMLSASQFVARYGGTEFYVRPRQTKR